MANHQLNHASRRPVLYAVAVRQKNKEAYLRHANYNGRIAGGAGRRLGHARCISESSAARTMAAARSA